MKVVECKGKLVLKKYNFLFNIYSYLLYKIKNNIMIIFENLKIYQKY